MNLNMLSDRLLICPKCKYGMGENDNEDFVAYINTPASGRLTKKMVLVTKLADKGPTWVDTLDCPSCGHNFDPNQLPHDGEV